VNGGPLARLSYGVISRAPSGSVSRARVAGRLAPLLERAFAVVGSPLTGVVVPVASGPAKGLQLMGERRSLAWISGGVERDVQGVLAAHLRPGGLFVDVGASIGFFSLLGARLVGPQGSVVAFEPQPAAVAAIERNAAINGFGNVTVVEAAVGADHEERFLRGTGGATAYVSHTPDRRSLRVRVITLDAYFRDRAGPAPSVVKVDVEGSERDVLRGMRDLLADARPILVIECHGSVAPIADALEEVGYGVSVVGSDVVPRSAPASAHLLATPPPD